MRKWTGPIRYKLGGLATAVTRYRPVIEAHMAALSAFSLLEFQEIGGGEAGEQMIIWFADTAGMDEAGRMLAANPGELAGTEGARRFFLSYYLDSGALTAARIVINTDHGEEVVEHCLLEEITQSLGLPNDDDRIIPSIFNDTM